MKKSDEKVVQATAGTVVDPSEKPAPGPDINRRRLIRGAAAVAPVIMTLRSGSAVAMASCSNATAIVEALGTDGDGKLLSPVRTLSSEDPEGKQCVELGAQVCPDGNGFPKDGTPIGTAWYDEKGKLDPNKTPAWYCLEGGKKDEPYKNIQSPIAIISGTAATSLTGGIV